MSSITFTPSTYSSTLTSNLPIITVPHLRPAYLSPTPLIRPPPPTYQHLQQQIPRRPNLHGAGQRKYSDFFKFQAGTTTTFNGYTNINGDRRVNQQPTPRPRRNPPTFNNNNNNYQHYNNNRPQQQQHYPHQPFHHLPSLMGLDPYHLPSRRQSRSFNHAQHYHPNHQQQHYPRSTSRSRFHHLSRLPSRSPSPSYHHLPAPPPIKPRRQHYNNVKNNNNVNNNNYKYNNSVNNVHYNRNNNVNNMHYNQNDNVNNVHYNQNDNVNIHNNNNYNGNNYNAYNVHRNNNNNNYNVNNVHRNNHNNYNARSYDSVNNVNYKSNNSVNTFKGVIISDSMCSRLRTYAIKKLNVIDVDLSFESGCDIIKMMHWLNTPDGQRQVSNKQFLIISLGTNDVGRYGVDVSLQRCSELIRFIRRSFPGIRAVGWLALSPRWKPTRFISPVDIGLLHCQFNERLQVLSKRLDFDVVDARLGPADMRVEDGLHPSTTTGRWKYEEALREWFSYCAVAHSSSSMFQNRRAQAPLPSTPTPSPSLPPPTTTSLPAMNNDNYPHLPSNQQPHHYHRRPHPYNNNNNNRHYHPHNNYNNNNRYNARPPQHQNNTAGQVPVLNNTQPFIVTTDSTVNIEQSNNKHPSFPSRMLIKFYPHKLKTKEQYFRENEPVKELEKHKDKLFLAANFYYQCRYFEEEGKKWKIYEQVSSRKETVFSRDGEDILMEDAEEIPLVRPYAERHAHILDLTVSDSDKNSKYNSEASHSNSSSEIEDEDKKKRKLKDTSISPTSKNKKKDINLRKKKSKSKKKSKTTSIENDPRAPEGSPVLLVSETNREHATKVANSIRPDTPVSPEAKRRRLFNHYVKPPRVATAKTQQPMVDLTDEISPSPAPSLPSTPPGLPAPPVLSPRQSTPRSPAAQPRLVHTSPAPATFQPEGESIHLMVDESHPATTVAEGETVAPMDQQEVQPVTHSPSVTSKDTERYRLNLFDFAIVPIECKFYFKNLTVNAEMIKNHRLFLEKKVAQLEIELEQLMKQFEDSEHRTVIQFIKNSIEPLIDILVQSNEKRLDNLILDQMREKALRVIRNKCSALSLEQIDKAQNRFERSLQLRFQLDKLDRRFNDNMPPPALNVMDKLEFRSRELSNESKEQYSEQWNSVIRKAKLDLTSIMRLAKTTEIEKSEKEHAELVEQIPVELRHAYNELVHTVKVRHDRVVEKKLRFLERKVQTTNEK
jgi:hypothetical protein